MLAAEPYRSCSYRAFRSRTGQPSITEATRSRWRTAQFNPTRAPIEVPTTIAAPAFAPAPAGHWEESNASDIRRRALFVPPRVSPGRRSRPDVRVAEVTGKAYEPTRFSQGTWDRPPLGDPLVLASLPRGMADQNPRPRSVRAVGAVRHQNRSVTRTVWAIRAKVLE